MRYRTRASQGYHGMIAHVAERLWHEQPERRISWESFTLDWVIAGTLPEFGTREYDQWIQSRYRWKRDINRYFLRVGYLCQLTVDRDRGVQFRSDLNATTREIINQGRETANQFKRQYLKNKQLELCAGTEGAKALVAERNTVLENGAIFLIGALRTSESQQAQLESEYLARTVQRTRRKARMLEHRQLQLPEVFEHSRVEVKRSTAEPMTTEEPVLESCDKRTMSYHGHSMDAQSGQCDETLVEFIHGNLRLPSRDFCYEAADKLGLKKYRVWQHFCHHEYNGDGRYTKLIDRLKAND